MARSFNGSTDYLTVASVPISAYPFTMACFFNTTDTTTAQGLIAFDSGAGNYHALLANGNVGGDPVGAASRISTYTAATSSTGYTSGTWHHAAGVWTSSTSRDAFIDGGSKGSDTNSRLFDTMVNTDMGIFKSATGYLTGSLANAAIWNVALTDAEIASLATGVSPLLIRPQSLVGFWPLVGNNSPETDFVGNNDLTVTGATAGAGPRLYLVSSKEVGLAAAAAAPSGTLIKVGLSGGMQQLTGGIYG